jgi:hypothetical protein
VGEGRCAALKREKGMIQSAADDSKIYHHQKDNDANTFTNEINQL